MYLSEEKLNGCYIDFGIVKGTTKACSSYTGNCFVENELGEILDGLWEELESMGFDYNINPQKKFLFCGLYCDAAFTISPFAEIYKCWDLVGTDEHLMGRISPSVNVCNLDICSLRKKAIGFSEQETILLADTVKNNLELFNKNDKNLNEYIEQLDLLAYIRQLDNGIRSIINTQQNNISGGEKQKISIIRQLLQNPDVMLFDEPTSALEINSKANLMKILREIKKNKIVIIVTHDRMLYNNSEETIIDMNLWRDLGRE